MDHSGDQLLKHAHKLIIKPSKAAVQRIRERLRTEMRAPRGANAAAVLQRLNPVIRGWAAYYRTVVSKRVFTTLDSYVWWLAFKWAVRSHRNKPKHWVKSRYFGAFNKARRDNWVFGDRLEADRFRRHFYYAT